MAWNISEGFEFGIFDENRKKEISQILSTTTDDNSVTQSLKNNGTFVGQTNSEATLQHTSTMTSSLTNINSKAHNWVKSIISECQLMT
jgi:hypothetical protein